MLPCFVIGKPGGGLIGKLGNTITKTSELRSKDSVLLNGRPMSFLVLTQVLYGSYVVPGTV